jgi:hypothetical protein
VRVIEDTQAIPMLIADETGAVAVDAKAAKLDFKSNRRHANFLSKLPKELEQSLRERYKIVTSTFFIPKQMRYTEIVIPQDAEVFVHSESEVKDGQLTFNTKNHPLYLSFRKEQDLIRNGKISSAIMGVAGVVIPILAILLAFWTYRSTTEEFKHDNKPAAKQGAGKGDAVSPEIAKLKNPNASLSERAWAARKLPKPSSGAKVAEVAPLLNPLLQSKDVFHRDSALMAIKQGWGTQANEATLWQVQINTKDARVQKEIASVLSRLGK